MTDIIDDQIKRIRDDLMKATEEVQPKRVSVGFRPNSLPRFQTNRKMQRQCAAILRSSEFKDYEARLAPVPLRSREPLPDVQLAEESAIIHAATEARDRAITAFVARKLGLK